MHCVCMCVCVCVCVSEREREREREMERYCEVKTRVKGVMEEKHHGLQNLSGQAMVADNCYHRTLVAI